MLAVLPLLLTSLVGADPSWDTVVVCPPSFRSALEPWVELRTAQGRQVAVLSNTGSAEEIAEAIRTTGKGGALRWLVLVGDAPGATDSTLSVRTPTHMVKAKVNVKWGSEPQIATDNPYADLTGDGLPDLAVGRLPADTPEELSTIVKKIIHYETRASFGVWRRKLHVVAGVGGFGKFTDMVLESTTKKFLIDSIPPEYETSMTYASWRSPYCPDPRDFHYTAVQRFNEGGLFWVYIGHGQKSYLDLMRTPTRRYPILDVRHMNRLQAADTPPIAVFLACYTGAFDAPRDCLAEEMVTSPGGPVAVLAGSRVTMPYAMAVMSSELMRGHFKERLETLGDVMVYAKRRMAQNVAEDDAEQTVNRVFLDKLAAAISPSPKLLGEERREHLALFNLLGDPLLRLPHPHPVQWMAPTSAVAGATIRVTGRTTAPGEVLLEFANRRDRPTNKLAARSEFRDDDAELAAYGDTYQQANETVWRRLRLDSTDGRFAVEVDVPGEARGSCYVRAFARHENGFSLGAHRVFIRSAKAAAGVPAK